MAKYGYARVSTTDQDLTVQNDALTRAGCDVIRSEKISGTKANSDRPELRTILDFIRTGDTLVVTRIDRLARSMLDLQLIVKELRDKGANLIMTEQNIDTSTASGRAFLNMLGVFAEFETSLRKERQMEGIAKAKEAGVYEGKGRRSLLDPAVVKAKADELGPTEAARQLNIGRATVYRVLASIEAAA